MATKRQQLRRRNHITADAVQRLQGLAHTERGAVRPDTYADVFAPAAGFEAAGSSRLMALDSFIPSIAAQTSFLGPIDPNVLPFATKFIGYPALNMLRQNILIQNIVTTYAQEMTKKWVEVRGDDQGDDPVIAMRKRMQKQKKSLGAGSPDAQDLPTYDNPSLSTAVRTRRPFPQGSFDENGDEEDVDQLAEDAKRVAGYGKKWKAEELFRSVMEEVGFSGGCLVFIDNGDTNLSAPMPLTARNIRKGSVKGFRVLEPMNCYAVGYNATNPLVADYFQPTHWMILNNRVHKDRLLYFSQNMVPFLLKPAYNFFGVPIPQMILDYLYNFERSRDAAARLIRNYSKRIISTDMSPVLASGVCEDGEEDASDLESLFNRVRIMQATEDNDGYLLLDKDREQFDQLTTSLAGMMEMVSQQMELLALVAKIPVTKLFGTPPRGFNATGDAEKEDFANFISGMRKQVLQENVEKFYRVIQLHECGYIVDSLEYVWPDLREATEEQKATIRAQDAQAGSALVGAGIIDAIEERQRLAATEGSGYQFIDAEDWEDPEPDDADPFGAPDPSPQEENDGDAQGEGESGTSEGAGRQRIADNGQRWLGGAVPAQNRTANEADGGFGGGGGQTPRIPLRKKTRDT